MCSFRHDLINSSFVKYSGTTVSVLYEQYVNELSDLLNTHASLFTCTFTKEHAGGLSDSYQSARVLKHQYKHIWSSNKTKTLNWSRLHKHTAWCNTLVNKEKARHFTQDTSQDP